MDKFIFLDVDGVLNCHHMGEVQNSVFELDEKLIRNLKKLIDETGAKIILSSSWLNFFYEENDEVRIIKYENGKLSKGGSVLMSTLNFHDIEIHRLVTKKQYSSLKRSVLIENFLKENSCSNYVIIDDENHEFTQEQKKHWVETTYSHKKGYEYEGLTEKLTQKAIKILNS